MWGLLSTYCASTEKSGPAWPSPTSGGVCSTPSVPRSATFFSRPLAWLDAAHPLGVSRMSLLGEAILRLAQPQDFSLRVKAARV